MEEAGNIIEDETLPFEQRTTTGAFEIALILDVEAFLIGIFGSISSAQKTISYKLNIELAVFIFYRRN